jgi:HAD superfamily hydrolase (TIGR01549 family)
LAPGSSAFKAILFDLDGTLIEFKFKVKESREAMIELLKKEGFDPLKWSEGSRTQEIIDNAREQWKASPYLRNAKDFQVIQDSIFRLLDVFEFEGLSKSRPHAGSVSILRKIKHSEILTGIVTNSGRAPVDSVLTEFGFSPYLSTVVTRNEMEKLKPHPHGLIRAMKNLGVSPSESLYVGDSVIDIEAARLAQMKCAAVSTGTFQHEALVKLGPDLVFRTLEELERAVLGN